MTQAYPQKLDPYSFNDVTRTDYVLSSWIRKIISKTKKEPKIGLMGLFPFDLVTIISNYSVYTIVFDYYPSRKLSIQTFKYHTMATFKSNRNGQYNAMVVSTSPIYPRNRVKFTMKSHPWNLKFYFGFSRVKNASVKGKGYLWEGTYKYMRLSKYSINKVCIIYSQKSF